MKRPLGTVRASLLAVGVLLAMQVPQKAFAVGEVYASAALDITVPSTPSNLVWTTDDQTVTLSWGASTDDVGVVAYELYFGSLYLGAFDGTSLALFGFKAGTPYVFTVKARDAAGNVSVASNPVTVLITSGLDTSPPSAPTNLAATSVTISSVGLRWTASTDDTGVVLYQVFANGTLAVAVPSSTSTTVSGLSASTTYSFVVKAVDAMSNVSLASATLSVTTSGLAGGGGGIVGGGGGGIVGGGGGGGIATGGSTCATNDAVSLSPYSAENNSQYNSHLPPSATYTTFTMCASVLPVSNGVVNAQWTWDWPTGVYVKERATPTLVYGFKPENAGSTTPNLPARVANVGSLAIDAQVAQTVGSDARIEFGVVAFLTSSNQKASGAATLPVTGKIFIYRNYYGMQYQSNKGQVTLGGTVWDYDSWYSLGIQYLRYSPHDDAAVPATSLHLNVADFLADGLARGAIQSDQWLASVETEDLIFEGTGSTTLTNYSVQFQAK
jgi:chitodextrinase